MPKAPNLLRKVLIDDAWKMLPVVRNKIVGGEQRYDLTRVVYQGAPMVATAGTFYLEYREQGVRIRRAIGSEHIQVKAALATQTSVLDLRAKGVAVEDAPQLRPRSTNVPEGKTLRKVIADFIDQPPARYRRKSYLKYRNALENFAEWTRCTHVVEVDRDQIRAFVTAQVRLQSLDVSTAIDKAVAVAKVLRDEGAPIVMKKGDWPKVTKRQRAVYKPDVLKKLFAAADENEFVLFQTFLLTGMREAEVSHLHWPDFDELEGVMHVRKKDGFDVKNYEERKIPIFDELIVMLKAHRKRQDGKQRLIFPTTKFNVKRGAPGGQVDGHILRKLKRLALRAGLNCGDCIGKENKKAVSCATHAVCEHFNLHMFRHTYATQLLRDGVDLLSLQKLLGHKDLDSTREYLRALEPEDLRIKVLTTSLATRFV